MRMMSFRRLLSSDGQLNYTESGTQLNVITPGVEYTHLR